MTDEYSGRPTQPGLYLDAEGDLWTIAPGSQNLHLVLVQGMRATDDDDEKSTPQWAVPFTRVYLTTARDH